jgi:uncharacterized protein YcbK (DUF882 family)
VQLRRFLSVFLAQRAWGESREHYDGHKGFLLRSQIGKLSHRWIPFAPDGDCGLSIAPMSRLTLQLCALLTLASLAVAPMVVAQPTYRSNVNRWHNPENAPAARYTDDHRLILRVFSVNGLGSAEVTPQTPEGGFDEAACAEIARVFGDAHRQRTAPIDRRLIEVVYNIARHFHAGQVTVISGYRAQVQSSNHKLGRAVDILIPGVADADLAAYARSLGLLGVGLYPHGGFVHVDVRDRSYFWVDRSGPGRTTRSSRRRRRGRSRAGLQEVHGDVGRRSDEEARQRGVFPLGGTRGPSTPNNGTAAASGQAPAAHPDNEEGGG